MFIKKQTKKMVIEVFHNSLDEKNNQATGTRGVVWEHKSERCRDASL
ncbi:hypothetical protein [Bacillus sp. FSL W8-0940]